MNRCRNEDRPIYFFRCNSTNLSIFIAAAAAPTPLLMFTTVTPGEQLVSIANKAVNPESAVP